MYRISTGLLSLIVFGAAFACPPAWAEEADPAPVFNASTVVAEPPSERQLSALLYLLVHTDENRFVNGATGANSADDEFGANAAAVDAVRAENKAALVWAREVLAGKRDVPATFPVRLLRYNMSNRSFVTDAVTPLGNGVTGWNRPQQVAKLDLLGVSNIRVHGWAAFSGISVDPETARALADPATGCKRVLQVYANLRIIPGSIGLATGVPQPGAFTLDANIREYRLGFEGMPELTRLYAGKIAACPYKRTAEDSAFLEKMRDRVWFTAAGIPGGGVIFRDGGNALVTSSLVGPDNTPAAKLTAVAGCDWEKWFVIGGNLFLFGPRHAGDLCQYSIEGSDFNLDGVDFTEETRIHFDESRIVFSP
jgi:hypothetical protein